MAFMQDEPDDEFNFGDFDDDFDEDFEEDFEELPDDDLDEFGYPIERPEDLEEEELDDEEIAADPFDDFDDLEADENTFDSDDA